MQDRPQQVGQRVIPCYDELIAFLKSWFSHVNYTQKPIILWDRKATLSATPQSIVKWVVSGDCRKGILSEIAIVCDDYVNARFTVKVGDSFTLSDKQLQTLMNLDCREAEIMPNSTIEVFVKSDGVNTVTADATIIGKEIWAK